jgi:RHH-type transcriptional regulator, rel operon repressor / antitoxin RelB
MKTMIAVRLPADINVRLEALAKRTGRSKTYYAREAILRHLEDMEDTYMAIERLENPGRRWTMEEIEEGADIVES